MSMSGSQTTNRHDLAKTWIKDLKKILHHKWSLVNNDDKLFEKRCNEVVERLGQAEKHPFYLLQNIREDQTSQAKQFKLDIENLRSQFTAALERGKRISEQPLKTEAKQKQMLTVSEDVKVVREKLESCLKQAKLDLEAQPQLNRQDVKKVVTSDLKKIYQKAHESYLSVAEKKSTLIKKLDPKKIAGDTGATALRNANTLLIDCNKRVQDLVGDPLSITRTTPDLIKQEEKLLESIDFWLDQAQRTPKPDKRGRDVNGKAQAQWIKLLSAAERGRDQLESLPGAEVYHRRLVDKIALAKEQIKPSTDEGKESLLVGHLDAIFQLQDYQQLVNEALKSYQNAMNDGLPEGINKELQRAKEAAFQYQQVGPASRHQVLLDDVNQSAVRWQLAIAKSQERQNTENACLLEAVKLAEQIENEVKQMEESKKNSLIASQYFVSLVDKLKKAGVSPSLYRDSLLLGKQSSLLLPVEAEPRVEVESSTKAWPQIVRNLNAACSGLEYIQKYQLKTAKKWSKFQAAAASFKKWAGGLVFVPALRTETGSLTNVISDIELRFKSTQDPIQCVELAEKHECVRRIKELRDLARKEVGQEKISDEELGKNLTESANKFKEALKVARDELFRKTDDVYKQLKQLEKKFVGIVKPLDPLNHPLRKELAVIREQWEKAVGLLKVSDFTQGLPQATNKGIEDCNLLLNKIAEALKDVPKYQRENFVPPKQELTDDPTEELLQLMAKAKDYGHRTEEFENLIRRTPYDKENPQVCQSYGTWKESLQELLKKSGEKHEQHLTNVQNKIDTLGSFLKKQTKWKFGNFRGFRDELEAQHKDLTAMLESGDPQLIDLASTMADELGRKLEEVTPVKGQDKDAEAKYKNVVKIYKALSAELGGHGKKVPHKLPETYNRISQALITAIANCEKSSPTKGLILLAPFWSQPITKVEDLKKLGKADALDAGLLKESGDTWVLKPDVKKAADSQIGLHVDKAVRLAQNHKQLHEMFKETIKEIEAEWSGTLGPKGPKGVKKTSGADDKDCEYFENWFKARMKEAEKIRHGEDGIFNAIPILAEVKKRLKDIEQPANNKSSLEVLQGFNVEDKKNFESLCNMAKQFEVKVQSLNDVTLKQASEYVKEQGDDGDEEMVSSLKKSVEAATKIVEPYLLNLSKVPHRSKYLADKAPNIAKATSDFNTADAMLNNVRDSANRLMSISNTTNVKITDDLLDVERTWFDGVRAFKGAVKETLDLIREVDLGQENEKQKTSLATARKLIEEIVKMFEETAFSAVFEKLKKEELTGVKKLTDKKLVKKQAQEKLAAREEALRIMRDLRSRLYNHPVIMTLSDRKANPATAQSMIEALAVVNVALKRVEIQSLIGVGS
ncbi:MAG: hypothetical protein K8U03_14755 [Planctomycetia bacterium]|nr:hypothetical protein [Planctomycetia bacterium]